MTQPNNQAVLSSKHESATTVKNYKIAIDGPAGAGKSTVAQYVARELGYLYIDTGAMYRAATWLALQKGIDVNDGDAIAKAASDADIQLQPGDETTNNRVRVFVNGEDVTQAIRNPVISDLVSPVSAHSPLRKVLVERQRELAKNGRVVLDGRDIGTVVLPEAEVKIYLDASPEVRARRRTKDYADLGLKPDFEKTLKNINERDERDSNRADSPLKPATDAVMIVTDNMTIEQVAEAITRLCRPE